MDDFSNVIHIEKKSYIELSLIKHSWLLTIWIIRIFISVFFSIIIIICSSPVQAYNRFYRLNEIVNTAF